MKKVLYSDEQKILQNMLRDARSHAGLTQESLAGVLGKPQSFVAKYETGERMLNLIEIIFVLRSLRLSPGTFVAALDKKIGADRLPD